MRRMQTRIRLASGVFADRNRRLWWGPGDARPHQAVSGTVTLDDKPLAHGVHRVSAHDRRKGVAAGGTVTEGGSQSNRPKARPPRRVQGPHLQRRGPDAAWTPSLLPPPGARHAPPADPIPAKYNSASQLTCSRSKLAKPTPLRFPAQIEKIGLRLPHRLDSAIASDFALKFA